MHATGRLSANGDSDVGVITAEGGGGTIKSRFQRKLREEREYLFKHVDPVLSPILHQVTLPLYSLLWI
jgi:hypothetical protein